MTDKQAAKWAARRSKGFGDFVVKVGLGQAGTFYALGMFTLRFFFSDDSSLKWSDYLLNPETWFLLVFHWAFFGLFMGVSMWFITEWYFGRYIKNKSERGEEM